MKKSFLSLVLAFMLLIPLTGSAALFQPDKISIGDSSSYEAGTEVTLTLKDGLRPVGKKTSMEYGVARTEPMFGTATFYSPITVEKKDLKGIDSLPSLPIVIPNIAEQTATTTYVAYVRYYEQNNPNADIYYFTDQFRINPNETPFTNIKNINLLQANGNRYQLTAGPSIYSPDYVRDYPNDKLSTSTAIEVTFASNQDLSLNPVITITRLRSDAYLKEFTLSPIEVRKGETYAVIPLPTLDYEPGIYAGKLTFGNENLKKIIDVQYIVSGDAVTVGTVQVVPENDTNVFRYEIFGVPFDLMRIQTSSSSTSTQNTYSVTTDFLDAQGKLIESKTQKVDFNEEYFTTPIPQRKFFKTHIENIHIKVVSDIGRTVFEANKNVAYTNEPVSPIKKVYLYIAGLIVVLLLAFAFLKKRKKAALITMILLSLSFSGMYMQNRVFGQSGSETPLTEEQIQANTAAQNATLNMDWQTYGHWTYGGIAPHSSFAPSPAGLNGNDQMEPIGTWSGRNTSLFTTGFLPDYTYQCGQPVIVNAKLLVNSCYNEKTNVYGNLYFGALNPNYPTYELFTRNGGGDHTGYTEFFSQGTITAPPTIYPQILSGYLEQHLGWDDSDDGWQDRKGGTWFYQIRLKNNCSLIPEKCTCNGRTQVCTKAGLPSSSTPNSPACQLQASCSISPVTENTTSVTFTQTPKNVGGTVSYKDIVVLANGQTQETAEAGPTKTFSILPGQTVVKRTRITDSIDNTSTTTLCTVTRPTAATITSSCVGRDKVFVNKTTGLETSRISNDPTCALSAECSAESSGNNVIFRLTAKNSYEVPVYKDVSTGETLTAIRTVPVGMSQSISQQVSVLDRSDQSTTQTTCSFTRLAPPGVVTSCSCATDGTRTCTFSDGSAPSVTPNACSISTSCACSGRNLVCRNTKGSNEIVNTVNNAAECALSASCEIIRNGTTTIGTVHHYVRNALGTVTLKDGGTAGGQVLPNPFTKTIPANGTLTQNTLVTDTDGSSVVTQCSISSATPTCACSGATRTCTYANGTIASQVTDSPQCPVTTECSGTTLLRKNEDGVVIGKVANSAQCGSSCSCSGRSLVCRNGLGVVTSTTQGSPQCSFKAECTAQVVNDNIRVTQILTNALGNATYKDNATGLYIGNPWTGPINLGQTVTKSVLVTDTFDGATSTAVCSATKTGTQSPVCACQGRNMVCNDSKGVLLSVEQGSSLCAFRAICLNPTINEIDNTATFLYNFTNRLGTASYKDQANPNTPFSNTVPIAPGGTIVRNVIVTDGYDNTTSLATCIASRLPNTEGCELGLGYVVRNASGGIVSQNADDARCKGDPENYQCACEGGAGEVRVCRDKVTGTTVSPEFASTLAIAPLVCPDGPTADGIPEIKFFKPVPTVVRKGESCNYVWSTINLNRCSLKVNGVDVSLASLGTTVGSLVSISRTTAGTSVNQRAVLTCEKDATQTQPLKRVTMSTTCSVNSELIQN